MKNNEQTSNTPQSQQLNITGITCSALSWWNELPMGRTFDVGFKQYLRDKYYPNRKISSFTEKEIEFIYVCVVLK
jgi:hypothetical protein